MNNQVNEVNAPSRSTSAAVETPVRSPLWFYVVLAAPLILILWYVALVADDFAQEKDLGFSAPGMVLLPLACVAFVVFLDRWRQKHYSSADEVGLARVWAFTIAYVVVILAAIAAAIYLGYQGHTGWPVIVLGLGSVVICTVLGWFSRR